MCPAGCEYHPPAGTCDQRGAGRFVGPAGCEYHPPCGDLRPTRDGKVCGPSRMRIPSPLRGPATNAGREGLWAQQDSNLRPSDYESPALTTAPWAPLSVSSDQSSVIQFTVSLATDDWSLNQRAGDGIRTREYQLGRLMPYHLATPACARDFTTIKDMSLRACWSSRASDCLARIETAGEAISSLKWGLLHRRLVSVQPKRALGLLDQRFLAMTG